MQSAICKLQSAGIGAIVRQMAPGVKIIGVEPKGANAMALSLARGKREVLAKVDTFADGIAVKQVGSMICPWLIYETLR